jgi:hypothetical protein
VLAGDKISTGSVSGRGNSSPILGGCLDLGISTPDGYVLVAEQMSEQQVDFVVLMEDRQPDFFLTFNRFNPESFVRLNRHGPSAYYPTQNDLRSFVKAFHEKGIRIMYGFWVHENRWITMRHPELLLTDCTGAKWHTDDFAADFNPLLDMNQDDDYGVKSGEKFSDHVCRQYSKISDAFGFDGLFLGDGGMGFRRFGDDTAGVNHYDYSHQAARKFLKSSYYKGHSNCAVQQAGKSDILNYIDTAADIWSAHWQDWIKWNCSEWAEFYRRIAGYVHSSGGKLAAYSCMNYGPTQAIMHGVDYDLIAQAGLDFLVFQTYDYAWRQHFGLANKDVMTNVRELASLCAYLSGSKTEVLFTAETADEVEKWKCPLEHTLNQTMRYSAAGLSLQHLESSGRQENYKAASLSGAFIVWLNHTPFEDIAQIRRAAGCA